MIGDRIIRKLIRDRLVDIVDKHVKDPKVRDECIEGITQVAMEIVKIVGVRQIIWYLWYAKKQGIIQRVIETDEPPVSIETPSDVVKES